jgi:hypothetical protein
MPWVGFESTIPVFERAKTFHALDRVATVFGWMCTKTANITHFACYTRNLVLTQCNFAGKIIKKHEINVYFYRSYFFRSYVLRLPVTFSDVLIVTTRGHSTLSLAMRDRMAKPLSTGCNVRLDCWVFESSRLLILIVNTTQYIWALSTIWNPF